MDISACQPALLGLGLWGRMCGLCRTPSGMSHTLSPAAPWLLDPRFSLVSPQLLLPHFPWGVVFVLLATLYSAPASFPWAFLYFTLTWICMQTHTHPALYWWKHCLLYPRLYERTISLHDSLNRKRSTELSSLFFVWSSVLFLSYETLTSEDNFPHMLCHIITAWNTAVPGGEVR